MSKITMHVGFGHPARNRSEHSPKERPDRVQTIVKATYLTMCSLKVFAYAPVASMRPAALPSLCVLVQVNMPAAPQKPGGPICAEGTPKATTT